MHYDCGEDKYAFDFKKEYKDLYLPNAKPVIIEVPEMLFNMVDGQGDPNTSEEYRNAVEILYGLSYSIKMSKKSRTQLEGNFDYVIPPWKVSGAWQMKTIPAAALDISGVAFYLLSHVFMSHFMIN